MSEDNNGMWRVTWIINGEFYYRDYPHIKYDDDFLYGYNDTNDELIAIIPMKYVMKAELYDEVVIIPSRLVMN